MAIRSGLLSITFRQLPVTDVIGLAAEAELDSIEWGGDIHVRHGDEAIARQVGRMTREAGLTVSAYGSYYRVGETAAEKTPSFEAVLASAMALQAPTIRVWAGTHDSGKSTEADWDRIQADLVRICHLAQQHGITIGLEYHGGTLTDTLESTLTLLDAVPEPNLKTFWQPRDWISTEQGMTEITRLRPRLANLHVFHWQGAPRVMYPLEKGKARWADFLRAADAAKEDRFASLEFVIDNSPDQFRADAATLRQILCEIAAGDSKAP